MKMMKKFSLGLFIFIVFLFFTTEGTRAEEIDNFDIIIKLNEDASIDVTERIDYNFASLERHGIYRDIPFKYNARGGNFKLGFSDFDVTYPDGRAYNFELSNQTNYKRIKIGDADKYVSGEKSYVISYKVKHAINYFADHDELYWNATGNEWDIPISNAKVLVVFPDNVAAQDLKYDCFEGVTGSKTACLSKKLESEDNGQTVNALFVSENLSSRNGLSFVVSIPKGVIYEPSFFENFIRIVGDNIILLLPLLVFIFLYIYWRRNGRDPEGRGTIVAQFEAPDSLTPVQVGTLYDEVAHKRDVSSLLISLAVKGFLRIEKVEKRSFFSKSDEYLFERITKDESRLEIYEKLMLAGIFSKKNVELSLKDFEKILEKFDKDSFASKALNKIVELSKVKESSKKSNLNIVKLSSLQNKFYKDYEKISKQVYKSLVEKGYFPKNPNKVRSTFAGIGAISTFVAFVLGIVFMPFFGVMGIICMSVSGVMVIIFGIVMPVKTKKGVAAREHILGFKLYLEVAEKDRLDFHNAPEKNPEHFEKLLPYAIVLGVEKAWAKKFEGIYNQEPDWYQGAGSFNSSALVSSLGSFQTQTNTSMMTTASSGGSGFSGGGSSGGGGGGGGGGSW